MQTSFEDNFSKIMAQTGYDSINIPVVLPCKFSLWGRLAGSMAYYYIIYDTATLDIPNFDVLKNQIDSALFRISDRNNIRHTVIINIFAGSLDDIVRDIERMINSPGEFALQSKYDIYYGVDITKSQILRNTAQPSDMDGCLEKIKKALVADDETEEDKKMFHVEHFYAKPRVKYPILFYIILGINLLLFGMMEVFGSSTDIETLLRFGAASYHFIFTFGEYHRLVTPIFLHIGVMHLIFNTTSLILFASRAERYFGHVRFAIIYMASGIVGNIAMVLTNEFSVGAGASGAIFGIMGALLAFTKIRKKNVENFNATVLVMMIIVGTLTGFAGGFAGMANVANSAHIGGLAAGLLLGWLLAPKDKKTEPV